MGMSMMRRFEAPSGTAGMALCLVSGLVVSPPAKMTALTVLDMSSGEIGGMGGWEGEEEEGGDL